MLPQQAHGGEFANLIVRPSTPCADCYFEQLRLDSVLRSFLYDMEIQCAGHYSKCKGTAIPEQALRVPYFKTVGT